MPSLRAARHCASVLQVLRSLVACDASNCLQIAHAVTNDLRVESLPIEISLAIAHANETVAVKKIIDPFADRTDCKRLLREIKILKHFKHDNVLGLVDILAPPNANAKEWKDVYIVSELMDTDLHKVIRSPQPLSAAPGRHCRPLWPRRCRPRRDRLRALPAQSLDPPGRL